MQKNFETKGEIFLSNDWIKIRGAREHNLKNISLDLPRNELIVMTGLSGSGKSSLAFDTIYAEGRRRYVESLSSYARQFLGRIEKPDVDSIEGLSPAIAIDQKTTSKNPRSTVGTVTEIYDYLRLLFARCGTPHCPQCGKIIAQQSLDQMVETILKLPAKTKIFILAEVVRGQKGTHKKILEKLLKDGFMRFKIDGTLFDFGEENFDNLSLEKSKKHTIEVVIDRLVLHETISKRLTDSIEIALSLGEGVVHVELLDGERLTFSQKFACPDCGISLKELSPRMFSFNSPYGACPTCDGLGCHQEFSLELIIPDEEKKFRDGVFAALSKNADSYTMKQIEAVLRAKNFSLDTRWCDVDDETKKILLYGSDDEKFSYEYEDLQGTVHQYFKNFEGVIKTIERRYSWSVHDAMKSFYESFMVEIPCKDCHGARLKPEVLAVTISDGSEEKNIFTLTELNIEKISNFLKNFEATLSERLKTIASPILKEIQARLSFLIRVGLGYLTLSRKAGTLSGGEAQRIRLATQIGSGLAGVLYVLDEPSIGLHQRDNQKLLDALKNLRDLGNTLIVVEHDEETMREADLIVDIGAKAGRLGGEVVACGSIEKIMACERSITGQYLSGKKKIEIPTTRRTGNGKFLEIIGASEHNLKNLDVKIFLGTLTVVTGVSGSGKSTLVNEVLYKTVANKLYRTRVQAGRCEKILGLENLDKIVNVDQSPIGRTPRSNPATYTGVFDIIRQLFAGTMEARSRGYSAGRFSFNIPGGRCESCHGDGVTKIEMNFLPDVFVPCDVCKGKQYNHETLEVKYKNKNIADVLAMTIDEACEFFENVPRLVRRLKILQEVGLGYITLGQKATTLSGGEAQRVKLATELSKKATGRTLYILDEPTTGLHMDDVSKLLKILQGLVDHGDTVVVIEHNLDVIKSADYILDLGFEGGDNGGELIAQGTPEEVAEVNESYTGQFLKQILKTEKDV